MAKVITLEPVDTYTPRTIPIVNLIKNDFHDVVVAKSMDELKEGIHVYADDCEWDSVHLAITNVKEDPELEFHKIEIICKPVEE